MEPYHVHTVWSVPALPTPHPNWLPSLSYFNKPDHCLYTFPTVSYVRHSPRILWPLKIRNQQLCYSVEQPRRPESLNKQSSPAICLQSTCSGYSIPSTACNNDCMHVLPHTHLLLGHTSYCVRFWARLLVILVLSTSTSQTPVGPNQDLLTPSELWLATLPATYPITDSLPSLNHCTYLDTTLSPWGWRHHTPVKHQCQHTILYSIYTQKTTI
jgi:hypothetical protein